MFTELLCLAFAVYYEAGNQPLVGKMAVAQVVMKRAEKPSNICKIVKKPKQFSFYSDGKVERIPRKNKLEIQAWNESYLLASAILAEGGNGLHFVDITEGATHYHAIWLEQYPSWSCIDGLVIGDHKFMNQPCS